MGIFFSFLQIGWQLLGYFRECPITYGGLGYNLFNYILNVISIYFSFHLYVNYAVNSKNNACRYIWLDRVLPGTARATVGKKVIADQLIASPLFSASFFMGYCDFSSYNISASS